MLFNLNDKFSHTVPRLRRSNNSFSMAESKWAATKAFSSRRRSRLSCFLWIGTNFFLLQETMC